MSKVNINSPITMTGHMVITADLRVRLTLIYQCSTPMLNIRAMTLTSTFECLFDPYLLT